MSKPGIIKPEIRYLLYFAVFWVVLLAAVTHFFGSWDSQQNNPNQQLVSHTRGSVTEIELQANRQDPSPKKQALERANPAVHIPPLVQSMCGARPFRNSAWAI